MTPRWCGLSVLRLLEAGPLVTAELRQRLGKNPKSCLRVLRVRGLISSTHGVHELTEKGRAWVSAGVEVMSGPPSGGAVTRTPQTLRAKAWRYLRIKKKATLEDILSIVADGVEKDAAGQLRRYLGALASVGVLIRVRSSWLLPEDRNTGPEAPALNTRTRTVTDVNTKKKWTLG